MSKPKIVKSLKVAQCPSDDHQIIGFKNQPKKLYCFEDFRAELMCATCIARERRKVRAHFVRVLVFSQKRYDLEVKTDKAALLTLVQLRFDVTPQIAGVIINDAVHMERYGVVKPKATPEAIET